MATLIPAWGSCVSRMTSGERRVAERLEQKLDADYLLWYDVAVGPLRQHPDFATTDRYYAPPGSKDPPARAEWRTPVEGWQEHEGRRFPVSARALWMLPAGPLTYADFPFDPRAFIPNAPPREES